MGLGRIASGCGPSPPMRTGSSKSHLLATPPNLDVRRGTTGGGRAGRRSESGHSHPYNPPRPDVASGHRSRSRIFGGARQRDGRPCEAARRPPFSPAPGHRGSAAGPPPRRRRTPRRPRPACHRAATTGPPWRRGQSGRVERAQGLATAHPDRPPRREQRMSGQADHVGLDGRADPERRAAAIVEGPPSAAIRTRNAARPSPWHLAALRPGRPRRPGRDRRAARRAGWPTSSVCCATAWRISPAEGREAPRDPAVGVDRDELGVRAGPEEQLVLPGPDPAVGEQGRQAPRVSHSSPRITSDIEPAVGPLGRRACGLPARPGSAGRPPRASRRRPRRGPAPPAPPAPGRAARRPARPRRTACRRRRPRAGRRRPPHRGRTSSTTSRTARTRPARLAGPAAPRCRRRERGSSRTVSRTPTARRAVATSRVPCSSRARVLVVPPSRAMVHPEPREGRRSVAPESESKLVMVAVFPCLRAGAERSCPFVRSWSVVRCRVR